VYGFVWDAGLFASDLKEDETGEEGAKAGEEGAKAGDVGE
jgi:hypothetical protein